MLSPIRVNARHCTSQQQKAYPHTLIISEENTKSGDGEAGGIGGGGETN